MDNPEEKAKELVRKYWDLGGIDIVRAKQCAIIDVENTIEALHNADTDYDLLKEIEYYQQVKQEMQKL